MNDITTNSANWTITIDCADALRQAEFWKLALGYVDAPPPEGWETWKAWLDHFDVPADERDDGATIVDPAGVRPRIGFLKVPEGKTVKNRVHLDIQISGGRHQPAEIRTERIETKAQQLLEAGATAMERGEHNGALDHYVMQDPEGNEFCVV